MAESPPDDTLSWENLVHIADLMNAVGERRFALLGGEPTLHPHFVDMVAYLIARGFDVTVFTSGILPERKLDEVTSLVVETAPERLGFVCNLNDPEQTRTPLAEVETVKRFLLRVGDRVVPGFNIYRTDFSLDFLFEYIGAFGLRRHLRLGLAHPIPGKRNLHIALPDIDKIIARLFEFVPVFERLRVQPGLDCGFPMCRFSDEQLGWLSRNAGRSEFGCGAVIDIGPDMSIWPCFPLSSYRKRSLFEFTSLKEVREYYDAFHRAVRTEVGGIYPECDGCRHREEGRCHGGCAAHSLSKFLKESRVRLPEVYS